jgi:hypothetical protein
MKYYIILLLVLCSSAVFAREDFSNNEHEFRVTADDWQFDYRNREHGWDDYRLSHGIGKGFSVQHWYRHDTSNHKNHYRLGVRRYMDKTYGRLYTWWMPEVMFNRGDGGNKTFGSMSAGAVYTVTDKWDLDLHSATWKYFDGGHIFTYVGYGVTYKVNPKFKISTGIFKLVDNSWDFYGDDFFVNFKFRI